MLLCILFLYIHTRWVLFVFVEMFCSIHAFTLYVAVEFVLLLVVIYYYAALHLYMF